MRKILLGIFACGLFIACEQDSPELNDEIAQDVVIDMSDFTLYAETDAKTGKSANAQDKCKTMPNLAYRLEKNPGLAKKMYDIEYFTRKFIASKKPDKPGNGNGNGNGNGGGGGDPDPTYTGTINIPVVVNILEDFPGQVTQAQITSQIAIFNEDFNNNNPNTAGVPSEFSGVVADADFTFILSDVVRKESTRTSWGTNDAMKDPSQGGIAATNTAQFLNVWVCNIGGGILGYAQFPGGDPDTDGVVIGIDYFGENPAGGAYGDGRTGTHEVGHWLNLRHIWGDGRCKRDDFVADTPASDAPNYGCPSYPTVNCRSNDMTMNYMDYVNDDCMYMFTNGQNDRMRALFAPGGPRESFVLVN